MRPVYEEIANWANGVNTSAAADSLPPGFVPRGRNTMLTSIGNETAQMGARSGMSVCNVTPLTGAPAIIGQFQLRRNDGTKIHLLVSDNGRLDKRNSDNTTSVVNAAAFTAGSNYPSFAAANNLAVISNGVDLKKTDGTTVWGVGMTRPAAPTAAATAGGAMSAGSWDVALTYFNSNTGEESSLSDFTTVALAAGNLQITVSWAAPADPQVTHVRVYLRKQTFGPNAYLLIAGSGLTPNADATWNGFVPATTSTVANVSDTVFQALKIVAPTTTANNPPTITWKYPVWHNGRMWMFDTGYGYYSNITNLTSHPESFDPNSVQPVNPNDGDIIMGAASAWGALFIFKKYSIWKLEGYDSSSWTVTLVSDKLGCGNHRTIRFVNGKLYWWTNTAVGPVMLEAVNGTPQQIAKELLSSSVSDAAINTLALSTAIAEVDEVNDILMWSVPGVTSTRNNIIIPWNYRLQRFVADQWTPMDIASMAVVEDAGSPKAVYVGNYAGQVFKWWNATNDGVPSGTTESGLVTAATTTTITDANAAFSNTGGKLIERYVFHVPLVGNIQRSRITSNTATQLTFTPAFSQMPVVGDSYVVGGIDWEVDTPWKKFGAPFVKKRFEALFLDLTATTSGGIVYADIFTKDDLTAAKKTLTFTVGSSGAVYDTAVYDVAVYASAPLANTNKKLALTGKSIRVRLRQLQPDIGVTLNKLGIAASILSTRT